MKQQDATTGFLVIYVERNGPEAQHMYTASSAAYASLILKSRSIGCYRVAVRRKLRPSQTQVRNRTSTAKTAFRGNRSIGLALRVQQPSQHGSTVGFRACVRCDMCNVATLISQAMLESLREMFAVNDGVSLDGWRRGSGVSFRGVALRPRLLFTIDIMSNSRS